MSLQKPPASSTTPTGPAQEATSLPQHMMPRESLSQVVTITVLVPQGEDCLDGEVLPKMLSWSSQNEQQTSLIVLYMSVCIIHRNR